MNIKNILPPTYLLIAIVSMVALHFLAPLTSLISFPWNMLGLIPFAIGVGINMLADNAFKRANTTVKPDETSTTLITDGVFRLTRNPMYVGFVLILFGIAIFVGSLSPYLIILLFPILMEKIFIITEEQMLEQTFGNTWLTYKQQVRRWL
ncbi:MAG: isoprenylcysteine carboxylmethyltransferase family protein [Candidatus Vecturithrix sp.]|jgi:protein-S-isoprenylcysteine O-methyltransferase Ste14|nr:isoprenylcysteine carboxylmethyltransferase family protein [Candidatus Vecturithrix sp.]